MRARVFKQLLAVGALGASCLLSSACLVDDDRPPLQPLADPVPAAPPPAIRTVLDADPGTSSGSDGGAEGDPSSGEGGSGTVLALPKCSTDRMERCCSYKGQYSGYPECTWIILTPTDLAPITHALAEPFQIGKTPVPAEVPAGITLSALRPDALYSGEECRTAAAGFRLAGPGLGAKSNISNYAALWAVHRDGTWVGISIPGAVGGILNWDTTIPGDAPVPGPSGFDLACDHADKFPETKYIAVVVYQINFTVEGKTYYAAASLRSLGEKNATGYMYMVEKKY
jgi:hypothetical protein